MTRRNAGFTLIELVVVLTIISILASIAIVNYRDVQVHAAASALSMDIHTLEEEIFQGAVLNPEGVASASSNDMLAALGLELPPQRDGLLLYLAKSGDHEIRVLIVGRSAFGRKVVAKLGEMRPTTATARGPSIVETVDIRALAVEEVVPAAPAGGTTPN